MPIYEYECDACGNRFELIQKLSDEPIEICPKCGEPKVHKLMSSPAIQFKGSGFYINDYARKSGGGSDSSKSDTPSEAKSDGKSSSDKSDKSDKPAKSDKGAPSEKAAPAVSNSSSSTSSSTDKAPTGSTSKNS